MEHDEFCTHREVQVPCRNYPDHGLGNVSCAVLHFKIVDCICEALRQRDAASRADERKQFERWTNDAISEKREQEIRADEREKVGASMAALMRAYPYEYPSDYADDVQQMITDGSIHAAVLGEVTE